MSSTPKTDAAKFDACVDDSTTDRDFVVFAEDMAVLEVQNAALLAALKEAMGWNWLDKVPPPRGIRKQCEAAIATVEETGE